MRVWIIDLDDTAAYTTRDMQGDHGRLAELKPVPGISEFLAECKVRGDYTALVTVGKWSLQEEKVKHLGLNFDWRRTISPMESDTFLIKRDTFNGLISRSEGRIKEGEKAEFVVIGDRLDRDIAVGNSLGFTTVRIRLSSGKYSHVEPQSLEETPDHTVTDFFELMQLPFFSQT